jgi:hypothetical protein
MVRSVEAVLDLTLLLSQPQTLAIMLVQFLLGLGLGYVAVKALKYVLAFIAILALGTFLSIWSLGSTPKDVLGRLSEVAGIAKELLVVLGLTSIGPVSIGFIIGALIALLKK